MKFKTTRILKDNVFKTKIARVAILDAIDAAEEARLEDDFGPVAVEIGGKFEAFVSKDVTSGKLTFEPILSTTLPDIAAKANFKFAMSTMKVQLISTVAINYQCDSKLETQRKFEDIEVSTLSAAEQKCKLFEAVVLDRIKLAVAEWKLQQTNFETEIVAELDLPLC